jgi:hypothetical protein
MRSVPPANDRAMAQLSTKPILTAMISMVTRFHRVGVHVFFQRRSWES